MDYMVAFIFPLVVLQLPETETSVVSYKADPTEQSEYIKHSEAEGGRWCGKQPESTN